ncbi:glycosyltransferase [Spiribacter halobius]|uniref:Glycosyl transferase family 1 domain-containing protein n=1 Tax=Sediminicurvatus halobius TaxID=2182432 RepID=A0A2U2MXU1_9GAMM|nr:glycosyltransferase [Spiribacter halobius]PWG61593.1 hypothetical protein DEM34_15500 [Spiribacter halobius]UEX77271.1 glycosyltransferase [Spiribacter halobius]
MELDQMGAPFPPSPEVADTANSDITARRIREALDQECTVIPPLVTPGATPGARGWLSAPRQPVQAQGDRHHPRPRAERRPDIPFHIVEAWGSSEEMRRHRNRAASLPNVTWHDSVADMRPLYRRARVVTSPGRCPEAWGHVATEPQVSGTRVLGSNRGGLPQAVVPGGVLLDPDVGMDACKRALSELWDNDSRYDALLGTARAHATRPERQPETVVTRFEDVLAEHCRSANRK